MTWYEGFEKGQWKALHKPNPKVVQDKKDAKHGDLWADNIHIDRDPKTKQIKSINLLDFGSADWFLLNSKKKKEHQEKSVKYFKKKN